MRAELKQVLAMLLRLWDAMELPANPLDQLTELLGGTDKVDTSSAASAQHVSASSHRLQSISLQLIRHLGSMQGDLYRSEKMWMSVRISLCSDMVLLLGAGG